MAQHPGSLDGRRETMEHLRSPTISGGSGLLDFRSRNRYMSRLSGRPSYWNKAVFRDQEKSAKLLIR